MFGINTIRINRCVLNKRLCTNKNNLQISDYKHIIQYKQGQIKIKGKLKMKKMSFMQMTKLGKILKFKELELFQQFDLKEQHRLYEIFKNDEEEFKQEFRHAALQFRDAEEVKAEEDKRNGLAQGASQRMEKFLSTQGINKPSDATKRVFGKQDITANFNKLYNGLGMLTLNMEKQAQFSFYDVQQRQNFIIIAQQDETIKLLEEQNETLKQQNEQIINLLTQLVNK